MAQTGPLSDRAVHFFIALLEAPPIVGQIISIFEQCVATCCSGRSPAPIATTIAAVSTISSITANSICSFTANATLPQDLQEVLESSPPFRHYQLVYANGRGRSTILEQRVRPINLLFNALGIQVTQPQSGPFLRITGNPTEILLNLLTQRGSSISLEAPTEELRGIYGTNVYRLSYNEVLATLDSQKIHLSPMMGEDFYTGLKDALLADGINELPNSRLIDFKNNASNNAENTKRFLQTNVAGEYENATFFELGTQLVISEDYRLFVDENGQLRSREQTDRNDAIRLISACGIRPDGQSGGETGSYYITLLYNTFRTIFAAGERGILVSSAMGMGVWGGDPELYWNAFFSALVNSTEADELEHICINPGHQTTRQGRYRGRRGDEFIEILHHYRHLYRYNPEALARLGKVVVLNGQDVLQLAHRLKIRFPDKTISLLNASDPDVTLGNNCNGEYVNAIGPSSTTEENFTAVGTNALTAEHLMTSRDPLRSRLTPYTEGLNWNPHIPPPPPIHPPLPAA